MDNSLRSDKSMLPHNASPHSPRSSIPLRHGKDSGSFGLVAVAGAQEPVFFPSYPSGRHPLYSTFRPRIQTLLHAGVWAAYFAALRAAACRLERERVWIRRPSPLAVATPYTAPSAPVARPFCTPAFGPRILRPYAPLRADWSESASGYGGGRCHLIMRQPAAEESFFTFAP